MGLRVKFLEAIRADSEKAYEFGFKTAVKDENAILRKDTANKKFEIEWDLVDQEAMDVATHSQMITDDYFTSTNQQAKQVIAEFFAEQRSIPKTVEALRSVLNQETWKLERLARTNIINASNEGRLAGYEKVSAKRQQLYDQGKITKKPKEDKYTLIVAFGSRTCDAHRELAGKIPAGGLTLDKLKELQISIGARHGMTLSGNSLLHANQRTVISRVV